MSFAQALAFFFREALVSLRRGWKVASLAILTIAVSLFVGGAFLLLSANLGRLAEGWRREARVVVYLDAAAGAAAHERLLGLAAADWTTSIEPVSGEAAASRFRSAFPGLEGLLAGWESDPLPESIEIAYRREALDRPAFEAWIAELGAEPGVAMVEDDRDWLRQMEAMIGALRVLGLLLGGVLLIAATFTIASVVRLTAYLYREEIAVLRLVGATEFMIRGPFVAEGLLQGLAGGALAVAALYGVHQLAASGEGLPFVLRSALLDAFLPPAALAAIVGLGSAAGLLGALLSLQREETVGFFSR